MSKVAGDEQDGLLVGHGVGQVEAAQFPPLARLDARLLEQLALDSLERRLAGGHAALRDLPGLAVERVAMLSDERDPVVLIEGDDAGGEVPEVDHAIDAGAAVRARHLVVPYGDPRVLVRHAPAATHEAAQHRGHRRTARAPTSAPPEAALSSAPMTDPRPAPRPRFDVQVDWDARIVVRDGVELSANIWRPVARDDGPARFPAILEMIPYGKDNWRRNADTTRGEWFAARGFALCRLDVRGTGSSGGVALDEYTADETRDGFDAVEWLAGQPWCSGNVGMWGISYGGFTSIQVAMLRPPHLRAIVPVMATDDRYLDDVHYRGGCVTVSELSQYAVSQVAMNAMPPDASFRGAGWRDEWRRRLEATPPWLFAWLRHQTDGPYWRQGSLAPDYGAIDVPIFNIGGWHDSYVDPAFRMQDRCPAPSHTLVGNWVHSWPHDAYPGPNLDELHEIARFFERHLDGVDNGWEDEPAVVWFEHDYAPPVPFPASLPGRWRAASAYPHPATTVRTWAFGRGVTRRRRRP